MNIACNEDWLIDETEPKLEDATMVRVSSELVQSWLKIGSIAGAVGPGPYE